VCKTAISEYDAGKMTAMTSKRAAATLARLQFLAAGGSSSGVVVEGSEETQLIMMLEAMRLDSEESDSAGKAGWVAKAMELLPACPNNPELFALLGQEAYACARYPASMLACKRAVATAAKIARPIPRLWRWFALAELCHGRALVAQIDPDKHDMASQDLLKRDAISHFVQAAKYGGQVPSDSLVTVAAQCMWNAAVSFMSSAAARQTVLEPVHSMVQALQRVKVTEDSDDAIKALRTKLYVVLFESLADAQRWGDGLEATGKALKVLPPSCHKDLWDFRMTFLGKLGKDTAAEMLKVKESGEEMVARVWTILAQSMSDKGAKLHAYYKAVEALEHKPLAQAEYLVLYGEFLYTEGFAIEDAQDQLIAAADALLELDTALADEEEASSRVSGSQSDARSQSSASSYFQPPGSAKGKSPRTATAKSHKSAATRSSRAGSSTVASTVVAAGGKPPPLNVGHLQELGRIYLMMAKMAQTRAEVVDKLLVAQHYLARIMTMSVKCINQQLDAAPPPPDGQPPPPEKLALPTDLQDWVGFDLSDEACALFMADKGKDKLVLNKRTCKKVGLQPAPAPPAPRACGRLDTSVRMRASCACCKGLVEREAARGCERGGRGAGTRACLLLRDARVHQGTCADTRRAARTGLPAPLLSRLLRDGAARARPRAPMPTRPPPLHLRCQVRGQVRGAGDAGPPARGHALPAPRPPRPGRPSPRPHRYLDPKQGKGAQAGRAGAAARGPEDGGAFRLALAQCRVVVVRQGQGFAARGGGRRRLRQA